MAWAGRKGIYLLIQTNISLLSEKPEKGKRKKAAALWRADSMGRHHLGGGKRLVGMGQRQCAGREPLSSLLQDVPLLKKKRATSTMQHVRQEEPLPPMLKGTHYALWKNIPLKEKGTGMAAAHVSPLLSQAASAAACLQARHGMAGKLRRRRLMSLTL